MSSLLPSYAQGIVYLYKRDRPLSEQLKLVFSKTDHERSPPFTEHLFHPLTTQVGLVLISLHEGPSTCEFVILENDTKHTVATKRLSSSRVSVQPLEQKIKEIEDAASQALKNLGDPSLQLEEQALRFRVQKRPTSCVLL